MKPTVLRHWLTTAPSCCLVMVIAMIALSVLVGCRSLPQVPAGRETAAITRPAFSSSVTLTAADGITLISAATLQCTSGKCCDNGAFRPPDYQCSSVSYAVRYQCNGSNVYEDYQYRYCSGTSAECGTGNLKWGGSGSEAFHCFSGYGCETDATDGWCAWCPAGVSGNECKPDPCANMTCDTPPADFCVDDQTLVLHKAPGDCSVYQGKCYYETQTVRCPAAGCADGQCSSNVESWTDLECQGNESVHGRRCEW